MTAGRGVGVNTSIGRSQDPCIIDERLILTPLTLSRVFLALKMTRFFKMSLRMLGKFRAVGGSGVVCIQPNVPRKLTVFGRLADFSHTIPEAPIDGPPLSHPPLNPSLVFPLLLAMKATTSSRKNTDRMWMRLLSLKCGWRRE